MIMTQNLPLAPHRFHPCVVKTERRRPCSYTACESSHGVHSSTRTELFGTDARQQRFNSLEGVQPWPGRRTRSAGSDVKNEMHRYKKGTAKSGRSGKGGKVKSRKQAIAIGLSKARKNGKKVPKKKSRS